VEKLRKNFFIKFRSEKKIEKVIYPDDNNEFREIETQLEVEGI
jgi:hypothetical protein